MIGTTRVLLFISILLIPCRTPGAEREDGGDAQANFTGEMKTVLYVRDVEISAPFYRDVLGFGFHGFAVGETDPYYADMIVAGRKFGLHEPVSAGQESKVGQQRLYFRVRDLDAQLTRVRARGGETGDIRKTDWMDMFLVRDPDGNEIVFAVTDPERHPINPWNTMEPGTRGMDRGSSTGPESRSPGKGG